LPDDSGIWRKFPVSPTGFPNRTLAGIIIIPESTGPCHDIDPWLFNKQVPDLLQGAFREQIIAAQPIEDLARASGETLVDGIRLAMVLFAHPTREPWLVFSNDLHRVVRAFTIDDKIFEIRISLQQDRTDGFLKIDPLVETGSDNADPGP
jgi:hypothetical protein